MNDRLVTIVGSAAVAYLLYKIVFRASSQLAAIPTIGYSNPILSYIDAVRFLRKDKDRLAEGYAKHKGGFFKIALWDRWLVLASGSAAEEMRRLPDDTMSFMDFITDFLATKYIFAKEITENQYHLHLIPVKLTKNLAALFSDVREEVLLGFQQLVPDKGDEWAVLPAMETIRTIVCRASNRIFVGHPLCRDIEWQNLNMQFAMENQVAQQRAILIPNFLKPILAPLLLNVNKAVKDASRDLGPIVEERRRQYDQYGIDYPDKPNDFVTWMMDVAEGPNRQVEDLVTRVLNLNFAAIHTSTLTMTHALYSLAANPELWLQPLREEVERVVAEDGWTKVAMTKMHKVDSFIKESSRINSLSGISLMRLALKDHTFSDGTLIPKGTSLAAPAIATHEDEANYDDPLSFNPWRFSDVRGSEGEIAKHQFVNTNPGFLTFGHGKHACPGRFFAANELKLMLAHLVVNYDVQLENSSHIRPPNVYFAANCLANPTAKVCFRKRQNDVGAFHDDN